MSAPNAANAVACLLCEPRVPITSKRSRLSNTHDHEFVGGEARPLCLVDELLWRLVDVFRCEPKGALQTPSER